MKPVALVPILVANLLAFYQLQMQLLLQLLLKLQEQEAEIMVNLQEICNLKKKRRRLNCHWSKTRTGLKYNSQSQALKPKTSKKVVKSSFFPNAL